MIKLENSSKYKFVVIFFLMTISEYSIAANLTFSAGREIVNGYTEFAIGGAINTPQGSGIAWFPISKLEFPLNVPMHTLAIKKKISNTWEIELRHKWNASSDAGKMKDSDWLNSPNSLDIYSESDSNIDASIVDIYTRKRIESNNNQSQYFGFGYLEKKYSFKISNLVQTYPSDPNRSPDIVSGLVATYAVKYQIPYLTYAINYKISDKLSFDTQGSFSPFVKASDKDQHLIRTPPKYLIGKSDGLMLAIKLSARYKIASNILFDAYASHTRIESEGKQSQYDAPTNTWTATTDLEINNIQTNLGLNFILNF